MKTWVLQSLLPYPSSLAFRIVVVWRECCLGYLSRPASRREPGEEGWGEANPRGWLSLNERNAERWGKEKGGKAPEMRKQVGWNNEYFSGSWEEAEKTLPVQRGGLDIPSVVSSEALCWGFLPHSCPQAAFSQGDSWYLGRWLQISYSTRGITPSPFLLKATEQNIKFRGVLKIL